MLTAIEKQTFSHLISEIVDGEEMIANKPDLHEKIIAAAKRKLEVKEYTVLALLEDLDLPAKEFYQAKEQEINKRFNVYLQLKKQNPNTPDKKIGGRSMLENLVSHDNEKLLKQFLFLNNITTLEGNKENLLEKSVNNNSMETTRLLLQYHCNINDNVKELVEEKANTNNPLINMLKSAIEREVLNKHVEPITLAVQKKNNVTYLR